MKVLHKITCQKCYAELAQKPDEDALDFEDRVWDACWIIEYTETAERLLCATCAETAGEDTEDFNYTVHSATEFGDDGRPAGMPYPNE